MPRTNLGPCRRGISPRTNLGPCRRGILPRTNLGPCRRGILPRNDPTHNSKATTMTPIPNRKNHQLRKGRHTISGAYYFLTTVTFKRRRLLSSSHAAQIVFDAFQWLENEGRIKRICIIIMPDHIHAVVQLGCNQALARIMHTFKSFTAKKINALLDEAGSVWQKGYYDHAVRDEGALNDTIRYCYENPVRSGLVKLAKDYPYWWCKFELE